MKRWAAVCASALAVVALPAIAQPTIVQPAAAADPVLVTVSPEQQIVGARDTVDITVAVASGASSTCTLFSDSGAMDEWHPCLPVYSFDASDFTDGDYRLAARAKKDGVRDWTASYFHVDTTNPQVEISSQYSQLLVRGSFYASWSLKKRDTSPTFEVEERLESPFRGPGEWRPRTKTDRNSLKFTLDPGETLCVRVRAKDAAGNVGDWSRDLCRTRYVDDRHLEGWRGTPKWDPIDFSNNINATALVSKKQGATLTLGDVHLTELVLLGRKGPYGGAIEIRIGGNVVERISLKSAEPKAATLFRGDWRDARDGRFVIEVTSKDGKYIHLDALILRR